MAARSLPLQESGSVTLDGSGNGTVRLRPVSSREYWLPSLASVGCSTNVNEAQCKIYIGPSATPQYFVDQTVDGSSGDSTDRVSGYVIARHQQPYIWAVWSGGDAGAQATMVVSGTKEIR